MKLYYVSSVRIPTEKAAGLAIVRQCNALARLGHTVTLLVPHRHTSIDQDIFDYYKEEKLFTVEFYRSFDWFRFGLIGFAGTRLWDMFVIFFRLLRLRRQVDVLFARDQWMLFLPIVSWLFPVTVLELHTKYTDWGTRYITKQAKHLLVISTGLKNWYSEFAKRADIEVLPSGVDTEQFALVSDTKLELRNQLDLPLDRHIFSYVGKYQTMGESKGVEGIAAGFAEVCNSHPEAFLYLVGVEETELPELTRVFADANIPSDSYAAVRLEQSKFATYLLASDVLLMNYPDTEHYRKFMSPTKLFAYMATGKPIVSTRLESITPYIKNGVVYAEDFSVTAYAAALINMINHYSELSEQANENRKDVQQYTWDKRAEAIVSKICTR